MSDHTNTLEALDVGESSSVVDIIDQLEEMVTSGRRLPFSASVVVNEDETLELIDRARLGLPDELVRARHTVAERDRLLEAAEREAEDLLERARDEAQRLQAEAEDRAAAMVSDHEVLRGAHERADAVVGEADQTAATTRREADAYAREVMEELDVHLTRALSTVRKGLEALPRHDPKARKRGKL